MRTTPLPVIALTGFLGSGKTTLLEHWLAQSPVTAQKSALVINDFGPVNIDAILLNRPNLQLLSITGGCVCCTSYGELIDNLAKLAENPDLELVWMETSGMAEPDEILDHLTSPRLQGKIQVQRLVQVIDAAHYPGSWRLRALEEEQLRYADWIVLNKADLVSNEKLEKLAAKIRAINPRAVLRTATRGESDLAQFWDAHDGSTLGAVRDNDSDHEHESCCGHEHEPHHHEPTPVQASTVYCPLSKPMLRAEFDRFLSELPEGIYRAKGFVRFAEDATAIHAFQRVSDQQETLLLPVSSTAAAPAAGLVFIGPQLDETWIKQKLSAWMASPARGGTRLTVIQ